MTNQTPTKAYTAPTGIAAPRGVQSIVWSVPSATQRGVTYEVRANPVDMRLECNCLAGVNGKCCWHVKSVASGAIGKPRVRYTPAPRHTLAAINADLYGEVA